MQERHVKSLGENYISHVARVNATTYKYHINELSMYNFLKKKIMKH